MKKVEKAAIIITCFGVAGFATYVHFGISQPFLSVLVISSLFAPAVYLVMRRQTHHRYPLSLLLIAITTIQSVWIFGSGYIQGTDGPTHVHRARELLSYGSFELYNVHAGLSEQSPLLYIATNIIVIVTSLPIHIIQLLLTPLLGIITVMSFFLIIERFYKPNHALLATAFLVSSLTFVGYGIQIRTSSMGIAILLMLLFVLSALFDGPQVEWTMVAILCMTALFLTHPLVSTHYFILYTIAVAVVFISKRINKDNIQNTTIIHIISIVLFIILSTYITGLIIQLSSRLFETVVAITTVENLFSSVTGTSPGGGDAAGGSGAGLVVLSGVWLARVLFVLAALLLMYSAYNQIKTRRVSYADLFLLIGSGIYLLVSITMLILGGDATINPERVYRYFEFFAAAVIARGVIFIFNSETPSSQLHLIIIVLVVFLAISSITSMTVWTIDTGLREGGEQPYRDYSKNDVALATFADKYMKSDSSIYGGVRTVRLFAAYSSHGPHRLANTSPAEFRNQDTVYYDRRYNQRHDIVYDSEFVADSEKIYENGYVELRQTTGSRLPGNFSTK